MDFRRSRTVCFFVYLCLVALPGVAEIEASVPVAEAHASEASRPGASTPFLRGMTVSCPGYGRIWGSRAMAESLRDLRELGVEWVSIHPYAGVDRSGRVSYQPAARTGYLQRAVDMAASEGVQLFWKPHLAYWGSFEWRGAIAFGDDERRWQRFFTTYREFIVDQARFAEAAGIPAFSVGLEYEATTFRETEWRQILAAVREVYSGKITYSANWDRLGQIPFWDAVDWIGVQAYFPLSALDHPSTEAIESGWEQPLRQLAELSRRYDKPVLFAEIGYDVSPDAAREPWQRNSRDNEANRALQRRLMEVALRKIEAQPFIAGMFWWKWIPNQRHGGDFSMRHPEPRETLRRYWREGGPARRPEAPALER